MTENSLGPCDFLSKLEEDMLRAKRGEECDQEAELTSGIGPQGIWLSTQAAYKGELSPLFGKCTNTSLKKLMTAGWLRLSFGIGGALHASGKGTHRY